MTSIIIKNFKCFIDISIPLNRLTVFAGSNANGKSTAIQSLLFIRRTIEHCAIWNDDSNDTNYHFKKANGLSVELNGSYGLSLGTSSEVISFNADQQIIELGIDSEKFKLNIEYDIPDEDVLWLKPDNVKNNFDSSFYLFKQEFYYLNAERIGPRVNNDIKFYDFPHTGFDGSLSAQLLGDPSFEYGFKVDEARKFKDSSNLRLGVQVNKWLNYILPGNEIEGVFDSKLMSSQIRMKNSFSNGEAVLATNIGFGISYVIPIILTALIAEKNSLFIVENPEAHLHPSAQSRIGRFLTKMTSTGVNIIIETHSDHVLNGIQLGLAEKDLNPEDATINFFSKEQDSNQPTVETIKINERGELSKWPKGFFDQSQQDYASLLKLRRND
jgi:predicted ATPase